MPGPEAPLPCHVPFARLVFGVPREARLSGRRAWKLWTGCPIWGFCASVSAPVLPPGTLAWVGARARAVAEGVEALVLSSQWSCRGPVLSEDETYPAAASELKAPAYQYTGPVVSVSVTPEPGSLPTASSPPGVSPGSFPPLGDFSSFSLNGCTVGPGRWRASGQLGKTSW